MITNLDILIYYWSLCNLTATKDASELQIIINFNLIVLRSLIEDKNIILKWVMVYIFIK